MAADEFVVQLHVRMRRSAARDLLGQHKAAFPHGGALVQDTEVGRMPHAQALRDAPHDFGLGCVGARRIGCNIVLLPARSLPAHPLRRAA
jgi:hypothetical protein